MKDLKNKTKQKNNSWSQECLTICYNFYKPLNIKKKKKSLAIPSQQGPAIMYVWSLMGLDK